MFSRLGLIRGTKKYRKYYEAHQDLRQEDDRVRLSTQKTMARIFSIDAETLKKNPGKLSLLFKIVNALLFLTGRKLPMNPMRMLKMGNNGNDNPVSDSIAVPAAKMANMITLAADKEKVSKRKVAVDPVEISSLVKELGICYGADITGIAKLEGHHQYSHRGDNFGMGGSYGKPIKLSCKYAIVVASVLNKDMISKAPGKEVQIASMLGYVRCSAASAQLVLFIKSLGYEALTDNLIQYNSPLTPLAAWAGIGQIGRCNMVVNREHGNRLKIAAVLTDLPLIEDVPVDFGLVDFCLACGKCARDCPAKAISSGAPEMINGILQWPHNETKCMEMWMKTGTGICMACCPFSRGVDPDLLSQMKGNRDVIQKIISMDAEK
jgi:ferredoxin